MYSPSPGTPGEWLGRGFSSNRMKFWVCTIILAAAVCASAATAPDAPAPGLNLTLQSGGGKDVRPARLIALRVEKGATVSPFLKTGAFTATWDGNLALRIKDEYV